jgi:hypothetical protein
MELKHFTPDCPPICSLGAHGVHIHGGAQHNIWEVHDEKYAIGKASKKMFRVANFLSRGSDGPASHPQLSHSKSIDLQLDAHRLSK